MHSQLRETPLLSAAVSWALANAPSPATVITDNKRAEISLRLTSSALIGYHLSAALNSLTQDGCGECIHPTLDPCKTCMPLIRICGERKLRDQRACTVITAAGIGVSSSLRQRGSAESLIMVRTCWIRSEGNGWESKYPLNVCHASPDNSCA